MAERCGEIRANGEPCKAWRVAGMETCAGHAGLGIGRDPSTYAKQGHAVSLQARRDRAEARKRTAQDWLAIELENRGKALVDTALNAGEAGNIRAIEWAFERVYGKPLERVESTSSDADIRMMTSEQRATLRKAALAAHPELAELIPRNEAGLSDSKQASSLSGE